MLSRPRKPRPLLYQISIWARHSVEANAESRCDGGRVRRNFPTVGLGSRRMSKKPRSTEKRWPSSDRAGSECARRAVIASRGEQSRCQVGPTISVRPPPCGIPVPSSIRFRFGPAVRDYVARFRASESTVRLGTTRQFRMHGCPFLR